MANERRTGPHDNRPGVSVAHGRISDRSAESSTKDNHKKSIIKCLKSLILLDFLALFWKYFMGTKEDQIEELFKRIEELEKENSRLHETVAFLTHKLYGSRSEKTSSLQIEGQMSLFDEISSVF